MDQKPFSWGEFLFSFSGRISRYEYWVKFFVPYLAIDIVAYVLDAVLGTEMGSLQIGLISSLYAIAAIWPSLAVSVKRCHDRDRSGWFLLITLIPIVGWIWLLVELGFLRGTIGDNRFGPDPVSAA